MVEYDCMMRKKEWGPYAVAEEREEKDWSDEYEEADYYAPKQWPRDLLTAAQLDYVFVFDELRYLAGHRDEQTGIHVTSVPGVYQSTSLIPGDIKQAFVDGIAVLENVPEEEKDWHPGSNRQVLDLVHPSLYWQVLRPQKRWLPTVFDVSDTGVVERKSYINNLHPIRHASLYSPITSIMEHFVPMFEKVLSDAVSPVPIRVIEVKPYHWYSHRPCKKYGDEGYEGWEANRWSLIPDPPSFTPPSEEGRIRINLKGRTIHVIVKLANITLIPENPAYPDGSWHVEGMENEKIVATGLYYASENITESRLAFRMQVGSDSMGYQHDDYDDWLAAFGFSGDHPLDQELGHVVAAEDKCVAFPNIYQHRVEPFELADPTRLGNRKILAFFLANPYHVMRSTMMVPPQQREWYLDEMERIPGMRELPQEIFDIITDYALEGTITPAEAKANREKVMEERRDFVVSNNEHVFEVQFSLCEH